MGGCRRKSVFAECQNLLVAEGEGYEYDTNVSCSLKYMCKITGIVFDNMSTFKGNIWALKGGLWRMIIVLCIF